MTDFSTYQSPFTWRYASAEMRRIWSEENKRLLWRKLWVALARVECIFGLVDQAQVADVKLHAGEIDIQRSLEIEAEIHHDLMAEIKTFAEQCPFGGGIIHFGATSMDIKDNAEVLQMRESLVLLIHKLEQLLYALADKMEAYAHLPCIAFTHLQPAEPTTLGYRFASYAQDLFFDWEEMNLRLANLRGKGFKGAVGTGASYIELVGVNRIGEFDTRLSQELNLEFYPVATQTYTRKQDYQVISTLSGLGASLSKIAVDLRILQSSPLGEWAEPFTEKQIGSSAMPFKRNPIKAEQINSLARSLAHMPQTAWHNAANSFLERTLDDSANRRMLLPESFLICDEILESSIQIIAGLQINIPAIQRNLAIYSPFANTERLLMILVKKGADRQEMHAHLRRHSLCSWQCLEQGQADNLSARIEMDEAFTKYLPADQIRGIMQSEGYTGFAGQRALETAGMIRKKLADSNKSPLEN